jgi:flavin reductase (DIM6/NTAB) family NADH-FMN oxidoreductase RutF
MFYEPKIGHGLPRDPFKALVSPRPIGWFTTLNQDGSNNVAPYSYFNAVADDPPVIFFSAGGAGRAKDSARNAAEQGEFVHNLVTWDLREQMNATSEEVEPGVDEAKLAELELAPSELVKAPRIAASPASFECRYMHTLEIPQNGDGGPSLLVFGEVIGIHIRDDALEEGRFDPEAQKIIARLGYANYAVTGGTVRRLRPRLSA